MNSFRVVTFNMQYGQTWDPADPDHAPYDLEATIALLRAQDADVILLQELEQVRPENLQIQPPPNFTALRDRLPGYHAAFAYPPYNVDELPFGYGQAILSRAPLREVTPVALPAPDLSFDFFGRTMRPTDRLMLAAKTTLGGRELQLFNAHLQSFFIIGQSSDTFRGQRDVIEQHLRASSIPTILGGDMNSAPEEGLVAQFAAAGFATAQAEVITWKRQPFVLDHLFHNAGLHVQAVEVVATNAADHELLRVDYRWAD